MLNLNFLFFSLSSILLLIIVPPNKNKQAKSALKQNFSKLVYIEEGQVTFNVTNAINYTKSDSSLFYTCVPSRRSIDNFYISATEVTNQDWNEFYNYQKDKVGEAIASKKYSPDSLIWKTEYSWTQHFMDVYNSDVKYSNFPVVNVDWNQVNEYCEWKTNSVNELLKTCGVESRIQFRLPKEGEWEYAAIKAPPESINTRLNYYLWTKEEILNDLNSLTNIGSIKDQNGLALKVGVDDGCFISCEVGSFPPTEIGLYDMAGNVSEWTSSIAGFKVMYPDVSSSKIIETEKDIEFEIDYIKENFDTTEWEAINLNNQLIHNSHIFKKKDVRICKGGAWDKALIYTQPGSRQGHSKEYKSCGLGFRIVCTGITDEIQDFLPSKQWQP